jgi:ankyrin repeat protein
MGMLRVDAHDRLGRTVLHIAASQGSLEAVQYLVSRGANPFTKDARGYNAKDEARIRGKNSVAEYLNSISNFDNVYQ